MGRTTSERRAHWDSVKRSYLESAGQRLGIRLDLDSRAGSRWGRAPAGRLAVLGAEEGQSGNHWWLGLDDGKFQESAALGVILLCESKEGLLDFAIRADTLMPILPLLSREQKRGERKINLHRVGSRYVLRVPGRPDLDVTDTRGDLAWLHPGSRFQATVRPGGVAPMSSGPTDRIAEQASTFFAKVRKGLLEPLDATGLSDGDIVLVKATVSRRVPGSAALRRIVARGGPPSLPPDFAEQHDRYAHGERS